METSGKVQIVSPFLGAEHFHFRFNNIKLPTLEFTSSVSVGGFLFQGCWRWTRRGKKEIYYLRRILPSYTSNWVNNIQLRILGGRVPNWRDHLGSSTAKETVQVNQLVALRQAGSLCHYHPSPFHHVYRHGKHWWRLWCEGQEEWTTSWWGEAIIIQSWAHKVRLRRADWEQCVSGPKEKGGGAKNVGLHKLERRARCDHCIYLCVLLVQWSMELREGKSLV